MMTNVYPLLILFSMISSFAAVCDRNYGPAGGYECVSLSRYQGKQWATCLTDAYIRQKSGGKLQCIDRSRTYCWYQCMIERYGTKSGLVDTICSCDGTKNLTKELPEDCYSPDGKDCGWYSRCLEKKYPCENSNTPYALSYARKYCGLYNENYPWFNNEAKEWVDKVRGCLQVALVPYIRDYTYVSCGTLREAAFDSHTPCYVNSGFCQLSCQQMLKVFWTIKGTFLLGEAPLDSLMGLLSVTGNCLIKKSSTSFKVCFAVAAGTGTGGITQIVKLSLVGVSLYKARFDRSVECPRCTAQKVLENIADKLQWNATTLDWIAFPKESNKTDEFEIDAYITDKTVIQSNDSSRNNTFLAESVEILLQKLESGVIQIEADGWVVTQASTCTDVGCEEQYKTINATTTTTTKASSTTMTSTTGQGHQIVPNLLLAFIGLLLVLMVKSD